MSSNYYFADRPGKKKAAQKAAWKALPDYG
jgi:hypothetical protein